MNFHCFSCHTEIQLPSSSSVGRKDACDSCSADLHACYNCKFHDPSAYNECREPQAERVLDKDRSNFCDYFTFKEGTSGAASPPKEQALDKLEDLFKK